MRSAGSAPSWLTNTPAEPGTYYVMVGEGKHPIMPLASGPSIEGNWRLGTPIAGPVPQPLVYTLDADYELSWLYVLKDVDGRPAVQLERLYHEVSAFVPAQYLEVPRRGPRGRFLPIKTPADLEQAEDDLRELVSAPI